MKIMVIFGKTNSFSPTDQISLELINSSAFKNDKIFAVARGNALSSNKNVSFCSVPSFCNISIKNILFMKKNLFKKIKYFFQRIFSKLTIILLGYDAVLVSCYKKTINRLLKEINIDAIISISGCYECNVAGCAVAHKKNINFFSYLCDPYPFIKMSRFKNSFNKVLRIAKTIFVPLEYRDDYYSFFAGQKHKIIGLEFPCLLNKELILQNVSHIKKKDEIVISYFGSLGYDGRNTNELSSIFSDRDNLLLNLYTSSKDTIHKKNIIFNSMISQEEMINKMLESNFLLVVDNNSKMLPSKCVRYVSTTIPIIVITAQEKSSITSFLSKYKKYYIHKIGNDINGLYNYIYENSIIPFEFDVEVYNNYLDYLPDIVFKKIRNLIN